MKNIIINVFDYVPNARVFLKGDFKNRLIEIAMKNATMGKTRFRKGRRQLAKLTGFTETNIYNWKNNKKRPRYSDTLKLLKIARIDKAELLNNISEITASQVAGKIRIDDWKLQLNEKFAEWLGLLRGDGTVTIDYVSLANNNLDLIFFFTDFLKEIFAVANGQIEFTVRVPPEYDNKFHEKLKATIDKIKKQRYERITVSSDNKNKFKRNEPNVKVRFSGKVLASLISGINKELCDMIDQSSNSVKVSYIRGFAAAEGGSSYSRGQRNVTISQRDKIELKFIEKLLSEIGIRKMKIVNDQLVITTRREIEKYRDVIGFGHHEEKNAKLDRIIADYKQYKIPSEETYQKIMRFVCNDKEFSCKNISNVFNIDERYTNKILNDMIRKNMLLVDKTNKTYIYKLKEIK